MTAELPKILLVEDDDILREINATKFELEGFNFVCARHGQEALVVLQSFQPDIILLDMMMPVMNGLEFLRHLRSQGTQTDVIILSNISSPESTREASALGAAEYLDKSRFTPDELTEHLTAFWKQRRRRQSARSKTNAHDDGADNA